MAITIYVENTVPEKKSAVQLCFVGQDCQRIPSILGATYGLQTKRLDLSYNAIRSLEGLEKFPYLEELVLDNNYIDDSVMIPYLDTLHTLSLNKNKVTNLDKLLDQVSVQLPNLRYLSLLGNVACPDQLSSSDMDERDYKRYRLYVLHRLPSLKFLDSTGVRRSELREARKRGALTRVIRPGLESAQNSLALQSSPESKPMTQRASQGTGGDAQVTPVETSMRAKRMNGESKNGTTIKRENSDTPSHPQHTGAYGVRRYKYVGHNSEGNRFIRNEHL
ncbi:leucine-rich melanocyte differentiation-associated protein-like isoform X2 [Penaeus chinensis]|uniref:leucine-rich melanocyte differentiation-associated protein-like isoform X2 n=1 Tax=Penaeus chinensis TaxID=139456 RepID=UPI001FB6661D|nr:leucine-rich melanocyte differentiation-associated protein-like isoform X2 [Penaeus chinensis]